jgi:hypothetical protein
MVNRKALHVLDRKIVGVSYSTTTDFLVCQPPSIVPRSVHAVNVSLPPESNNLLVNHPKSPWTSWIASRKRQVVFWLIALVVVVLATHWIDLRVERYLRGDRGKLVSGAWGDLQEWDIRLEQPLEYVGFEKTTEKGPFWSFGTLTEQAVHDLLIASGCSEDQAKRLIQSRMSGTGAIFVLQPDPETILSLTPETRSKLYLALSQNQSNRFQDTPYFIPDGNVDELFSGHKEFGFKGISLIKKLCYQRNGFTYFSDPEVVLKALDSDQRRLAFMQVLTGQNAVLARLLIRPESDIDKPLNYWALSMHGVLLKDLMPLLQAQKREPNGGSLSILYLLPSMARERLFTSPLPPQNDGQKLPDCHWTALNFFNANPDPRMNDNGYASQFIQNNYYEVAKPSIAGDLVLLVNQSGQAVHSAVYLADDLVFTKNGINYAQPWILMHIKDMQGNFSALEPVKVAYFRRKGI